MARTLYLSYLFFLVALFATCDSFITIPLQRTTIHSATRRFRPLSVPLQQSNILAGENRNQLQKVNYIDFPMGGNVLPVGIYWTKVALGTPLQYFQIAVDTGSTDLLLPAAGCVGCHTQVTGSFNVSASSSAKPVACGGSVQCANCRSSICQFFNSYQTCNLTDPTQTCSVSGPLYTDIFAMGPLRAPIIFGLITMQTPNFQQFFYIDGLIGFAFDGASSWGGTAAFEALVKTDNIPNVFSMCLNITSGGVITLGGADPELYHGRIEYTPMLSNVVYVIEMTDIKVNGKSIGVPSSVYQNNVFGGCVVDSGTNTMLLTDDPYTALMELMQRLFNCPNAPVPGVCPNATNLFSGACYNYTAADLKKFPNLELVFKGVTLKMGPSNYLLPNIHGQYCFAIDNSGPDGLLIIGDTVMSNYYAVFDRANKRLGWAPANAARCKSR